MHRLTCPMVCAAALVLAADVHAGTCTAVEASPGARPATYDCALAFSDGSLFCWGGGDVDRLTKARADNPGDAIFVYRDEAWYAITTPELLASARAVARRLRQLDAYQLTLGRERSSVADAQGRCADEQERLAARLDSLEAHGLGDAAETRAVTQALLAVGMRQDRLSDRQDVLALTQFELGRQRGDLTRALELEVDRLIEAAFSRGVARPT